uniref:Nephronophthisis 4 n=1 Tax=Nothobranchius furzeri TaxID=105023 RepID=A0A8C6LGP4_NOTFU
MVETEDNSSTEDGWEDVFMRNRFVPPCSQAVRLAEVSAGEDVTFQLRATLFDRKHQHFFGKTWKSLPQKIKNNKIPFNEVTFPNSAKVFSLSGSEATVMSSSEAVVVSNYTTRVILCGYFSLAQAQVHAAGLSCAGG